MRPFLSGSTERACVCGVAGLTFWPRLKSHKRTDEATEAYFGSSGGGGGDAEGSRGCVCCVRRRHFLTNDAPKEREILFELWRPGERDRGERERIAPTRHCSGGGN